LVTAWWEVSTTAIMDTSVRSKRGRRCWAEALKREIVAASLAPGASASVVARRYDVNANQVFAWRKLYGAVAEAPPVPRLVPVTVTPDAPAAPSPWPSAGMIEIALPGGYCVRVGCGVTASALRPVPDALERR